MSGENKNSRPAITRHQAQKNPEKQKELESHLPPTLAAFYVPTKAPVGLPRTPIKNSNEASVDDSAISITSPHSSTGDPTEVVPTAPTLEETLDLAENPGAQATNEVETQNREPAANNIADNGNPDPPPPAPGARMAQSVRLRDALVAIPEFDGTNIPLEDFLEGCKDAKSMVDGQDEPGLVKYLKLKIKGEAKRAIRDETFNTLQDLEKYLKKIFVPCQTVPQLLGELSQQYQRDAESVIAFANRVRSLGTRILEAQKQATGAEVAEDFRRAVNQNIKDCFKRGLKPEIESKLAVEGDVANLVQAAIVAEKEIAARNLLRGGLPLSQNKPRKVMAVLPEATGAKPKLSCDYCKMTNHTEDKCYRKQREQKNNKSYDSRCQLCDRTGHTAKQCGTVQSCQLCNQLGHSAKQCPKNGSVAAVCQICDKPGHVAKDCYTLRNRQQGPSNNFCVYCKKTGHLINNCSKRQNNSKNLNGNPRESVPRENLPVQTRSTNCAKEETLDELLLQLLPMSSEE